MSRLFLVVLALIALSALPAKAAETYYYKQPDLLSFGLAYADFDKTQPRTKSLDMRAEYRWGTSLLPLLFPSTKSWDNNVQFHPFAGIEANSYGSAYGLGGWAMDWYITRHWVFDWSEGAGLYYRGVHRRMGSVLQFRSQAEIGWQMDNGYRLTLEFSHISDAKITNINPGQEIIGVYAHIPVNW